MGRSPCCDDVGVKKGPWTPEEDKMLVDYIQKHGHGSWRQLPKLAGLNRCGKSCRLRWSNYLRPDIKRGKFEEDEERLIIHLHSILGNKWSAIATRLPGRTDNEIKNYWNTHLRKKLLKMGIDPVTHQPRTDLNLLAGLPNLLASTANLGNLASYWDNLSLLQARFQLSQNIIQILASSSSTPKMDPIQSLLGSSSLLRNNQFSDLIQFKRQLEGLFTGSLGLTQDSMPNLEIPQQASSFQACMDSIHSSEGQQMVAPISGSCIINGSSVDQAANSYFIPTTNSNVPLVSTSPENIAMDQMQEPNNSSDISVSSPTSAPFEAWEGLKLDDMDSELCWKDILDQISQSNASQSMEQSQL